MASLAGTLTSVRLTFKVHRFVVVAAIVSLVGLAIVAFGVKALLDAVGVSQSCLEVWLSPTQPPAACAGPVHQWAGIVEDQASKTMAAMLILPFAVGLFLGVPLVGAEVEHRTAAIAWALAASRPRWLAGRGTPLVVLLLVLGTLLSVASDQLQTARSADGIWESSFDQSLYFGPPVIAHGVLGFAIGALLGSILGRAVPALMIGAVFIVLAVATMASVQTRWLPPRPEVTANVFDPAWEYRFGTPDGRFLTLNQAVATVPSGTPDIQAWLLEHYEPDLRGPSAAVTSGWQWSETIGALVASGVLLAVTFPVVVKRRPS